MGDALTAGWRLGRGALGVAVAKVPKWREIQLLLASEMEPTVPSLLAADNRNDSLSVEPNHSALPLVTLSHTFSRLSSSVTLVALLPLLASNGAG